MRSRGNSFKAGTRTVCVPIMMQLVPRGRSGPSSSDAIGHIAHKKACGGTAVAEGWPRIPPHISLFSLAPPWCLAVVAVHHILDHIVPSSRSLLAVAAIQALVGGVAWSGQNSFDRVAPPCVLPLRCPTRGSVRIEAPDMARPFPPESAPRSQLFEIPL